MASGRALPRQRPLRAIVEDGFRRGGLCEKHFDWCGCGNRGYGAMALVREEHSVKAKGADGFFPKVPPYIPCR